MRELYDMHLYLDAFPLTNVRHEYLFTSKVDNLSKHYYQWGIGNAFGSIPL